MPAIFGLTCANIVLTTLAEYPIGQMSSGIAKLRPKLYTDIHTSLKSKYDSYGEATVQPNCPFSVDDVGYIIEEVFRGRSVLDPFHTTRLNLVRWKAERPVEWGNVVCMTKAESTEHEKKVLNGNAAVEEVYEETVVSRVEQIWKEEGELRGARWGLMYLKK